MAHELVVGGRYIIDSRVIGNFLRRDGDDICLGYCAFKDESGKYENADEAHEERINEDSIISLHRVY